MSCHNLHILTGAPGSGKTAILSCLRERIHCIDEPAREVLAEQRAIGGNGVPETNPRRFVDLLLQRSIENHEQVGLPGEPVLFDRGIPDCVAYARILGTDPEPSARASRVHRYCGEVLVTKPWVEIYTTDDERKMDFAATLEFQNYLEAAYDKAGYKLVEVPRGSPEERASFVWGFIVAPQRAKVP